VISEPALEPHTSSPERLQDRDNMRAAAELLDAAGWPIAPPPPVPPTLSTGVAAGIGAVLLLIVAVAIIKMKSTVVRAGALVAGVVGGGFVYTASQPVEQEGDGMRRNAQGETLALNYLFDSSSSPTTSAVMENFVANVGTLGIDITLERVDPAQYTTRERDRDYDLVFDSYAPFLGTGTGLMQRYGSEAAAFSLFNPAGLASPLVDAIIDRSLNAANREEEEASLMALDRALRYEFIMIPVWYNPSHWVAYYDQYEHPEQIPPYSLGQLDFWWYNEDKAAELRAAGALR
jgi:ABC-type oligopeptide transport system substrate-binding subunit